MIRKIIKILLYGLLLLLIAIPIVNLSIASSKPVLQTNILRIGHRGAAGLAPENTFPAMDSGLAHHINYIETDIRQTRDGELVIMHDKTVDRTTDGQGAINKLMYTEISKLNASKSFSGYGSKTKVPLLKEVLAKINGSNVKLIIEIKDPALYPGIVSKLVSIIQETNTIDKVAIFSFDKAVIRQVKKAMPGVQTGIFCIGVESVNDSADFISPNWVSILYFPSLVNTFHKKGAKVLAWTPNTPFWINYLCKMKVDGIITDRPDILDSLLNTYQSLSQENIKTKK